MVCPRCNGTNVNVTTETTGMSTRNRGRGCLWGIGRATLIVCTCGLWLLVGKSKGKSNTNVVNKTVCICQDCGYKWYI